MALNGNLYTYTPGGDVVISAGDGLMWSVAEPQELNLETMRRNLQSIREAFNYYPTAQITHRNVIMPETHNPENAWMKNIPTQI